LNMLKNSVRNSSSTRSHRNVFPDSHVELPCARPTGIVPRCVAKCISSRRHEGSRIEPLADGRAPRWNNRYSRHQIRTLIGSVSVGRSGR
jgi:hypothetical protein